ncbi:MAG: DUF1553 domain-containing protein, partial [Planctomycetales bacterium]|nr:DUF1553 domain-containing protein [Planctomycetales bacterium]
EVFDALLLGRRGQRSYDRRRQNGWMEYLESRFNVNERWDAIVAEILRARPTSPGERGVDWYLYERGDNFQEIAESISPAFFGIQIQCAQCHDHPLASEIEQRHYWGLVAFFNRGKRVDTSAGPRVGESAVGGFSKFTDLSGDTADVQLTFLGKHVTIPERRPLTEAEDKDASEKYFPLAGSAELPPFPMFSRREQFVDNFVLGNPLVARAFVNRMWGLLLGRGIVHPVDKMNSMYDPSHPELLDWLTQDFEQSGYDIKRLVRAIVASTPYQLECRPTTTTVGDECFAWGIPKPMTAESYYRSILMSVDGSLDRFRNEVLLEFQEQFPDVFAEQTETTLKQSLFLSNNPFMQEILRPLAVDSMTTPTSVNERIVEAFCSTLGRVPDEVELAHCRTFLGEAADMPAETSLWWSLVTSAEFRFNH